MGNAQTKTEDKAETKTEAKRDPKETIVEALEKMVESANNEEQANRATQVLRQLKEETLVFTATNELSRREGATDPITVEMKNYERGYHEKNRFPLSIDPTNEKINLLADLGSYYVDLMVEVNEEELLLVLTRGKETNENGDPLFGDSDVSMRVKKKQTVADSNLTRKRVSFP
jgi:hypothetical protein